MGVLQENCLEMKSVLGNGLNLPVVKYQSSCVWSNEYFADDIWNV